MRLCPGESVERNVINASKKEKEEVGKVGRGEVVVKEDDKKKKISSTFRRCCRRGIKAGERLSNN